MKKQQRRSKAPLHVGKVQKNPRGFGFVIHEASLIPDAYIPASEAQCLLDGDRIEYRVQSQRGRMSAEVVKILEREITTLMGKVLKDKDQFFLQSLEGEFELAPSSNLSQSLNHFVLAKITRYPNKNQHGLAQLKQVLGNELKPSQDNAITLASFGLERQFSKAALQEVEKLSSLWKDECKERKQDLTTLPLVTIDGEDAKDFDDAVYVSLSPPPSHNTAFILYVAIADVSFFVRSGSPLDDEAKDRATSVYFPGYCQPMLPPGLSEDLCSLRPKETRLAQVCEIHYDRDANVLESKFYPAVIKTAGRLTYTQVQAFIDGDKKTQEDLSHLKEPLQNLKKLYKKLSLKKIERGALDFELPEFKVEVSSEGVPTKIQVALRFESHRWIEEFMIAANEQAAKRLGKHGMFRVHEPPDHKALETLNALLKASGCNLRIEQATPKSFQTLLEKTKDHPAVMTLHKAILRSQKQARYEALSKGHFGLALRHYTHFTSPIRRYPDLEVHRGICALTQAPKKSDKNGDSLEETAAHCSEMERRAQDAERFIVRRKQCWYMKNHIGDIYEGTVQHVTAMGLFVAHPETGIEGFLPVESLGAFFEFDDKTSSLVRRPGKNRIRVGDKINVQVSRVSVTDQEISLEKA